MRDAPQAPIKIKKDKPMMWYKTLSLYMSAFIVLLALMGCSKQEAIQSTTEKMRQVTIGKGDTYYSIAQRHKISVRMLIAENNAKPPYRLQIGDVIRIPNPSFYVVRKGDTLYSIARRYQVEINRLARQNKIKPPYILAINTQLILPDGASKIASPRHITPINGRARLAVRISKATKPPIKTVSQKTLPRPQQQNPPSRATKARRAHLPPISTHGPNRFIEPLRGKLISAYGPKKNGFHNDGINIAAPEGTPIKAVAPGVVVYVGNELKGYGNLILIRHHQEWVSAYAHVSQFNVRIGGTVKTGDIIAEVGRTGNVEKPQLHFELRKGTRAVNPQSFI